MLREVVIRVLADANVLHSRTLRDWALMLNVETKGELFTMHYTEDILAETIATIRRRHVNLDGTAITLLADRIRTSMTDRIDRYPLRQDSPVKDDKDHHVHAAAVAAGMDMLVTLDNDFLRLADEATYALPYEIICPDDFFVLIDDSDPRATRTTTLTARLLDRPWRDQPGRAAASGWLPRFRRTGREPSPRPLLLTRRRRPSVRGD